MLNKKIPKKETKKTLPFHCMKGRKNPRGPDIDGDNLCINYQVNTVVLLDLHHATYPPPPLSACWIASDTVGEGIVMACVARHRYTLP